jgi:SagB-type dehydrogenase family enzyme
MGWIGRSPFVVGILVTALLAACAPSAAGPAGARVTAIVTAQVVASHTSSPVPQATGSLRASETRSPTSGPIALPAPQLKGTLTLEEALAQRRSVRDFSDTPLTLAELGQLLWAAQGTTHPSGLRTAPSAGALYPLEVYAVTREAAYHYEPSGHRMTVHRQGDVRPALHAAALQQEPVLRAPVVIVISAVYARTAQKYGAERTPRYVQLEAGHAAQNVLLQATALGLGAVPIGAFEDNQVKQVLALLAEQQVLYLIPIGHPR